MLSDLEGYSPESGSSFNYRRVADLVHADGLYLGHKYHEGMIDRTTGTDYHWYKVGYDAGVAEFCFAEGDE